VACSTSDVVTQPAESADDPQWILGAGEQSAAISRPSAVGDRHRQVSVEEFVDRLGHVGLLPGAVVQHSEVIPAEPEPVLQVDLVVEGGVVAVHQQQLLEPIEESVLTIGNPATYRELSTGEELLSLQRGTDASQVFVVDDHGLMLNLSSQGRPVGADAPMSPTELQAIGLALLRYVSDS